MQYLQAIVIPAVLLAVLPMPLTTQYRIKKAKRLLKNGSSTKELVASLGKPHEVISSPGKKLLNGFTLTLSNSEKAWIYNQEGIP